MILYHGTNKTTKDKLLKNGFEHRKGGTYTTNKLSEAEKYARSYAKNNHCEIIDEPALITIDATGWNIMDVEQFESSTGKRWGECQFPELPDALHTDKNAGYFMVFNTEKLNKSIKECQILSL